MNFFEEKLKRFIRENGILAEYFVFEGSCHSVGEAARAANVSVEEIVKSICLIDLNGNLIVAIVNGIEKIDFSLVASALNISKPRIATIEEVLQKTGFPCGSVPPFGYASVFLIDPKIMEKEFVFAGSGSENSLVKISPKELQKANNGKIFKISR